MNRIEDKIIDMILCDLPYGLTSCKWDSVIPLDRLWEQYTRIIKDDGVVALFGTQPFTTDLINSARWIYRYNWMWQKNNVTGFIFAKYQPMRKTEDICIFYKKAGRYYPQGLTKHDAPLKRIRKANKGDSVYHICTYDNESESVYENYPTNVLEFTQDTATHGGRLHPTQKPLKLCEHLIQTYTRNGEIVLDNCIGSGTTAVAAINLGRRFIGFESDKRYFDIAIERVAKAKVGSR